MNVSGYSATESNLHAMDEHEKWPTKCTATSQGNNVPDVNSKLIEIAAYAMSSLDASDTGEFSERKLRQCHDG